MRLSILALVLTSPLAQSFSPSALLLPATRISTTLPPLYVSRDGAPSATRRSLISSSVFFTATILCNGSAHAIPMVSTDEFSILLRDSSMSIQVVEFSGPKSETVIVRLVDGTTFGIKDVIESATDPRSPLKLAAACRESGVKTKFVDLESVLASAPKKKKLYTNQRVQEAQEKERERQERIRRDEEERLEQLRKLELEEEQSSKVSAIIN